MTWICDKHFFPLVCLQKCRHITQQTHPKTTWHSADPCSLPPDREKEEGKKDDSSFRSDIKHWRESGKKKKVGGGEKMVTSLLWQLAEEAWQMQSNFSVLPCFFSLPPSYLSISPSLCVSLAHQNPALIRISASHVFWMGYENTQRTQGVKCRD